jgi:hypothetical protein
MAVHMDETHDQAQQLALLRQFMFWLLLALVASMIALAALAAIFRSPMTVTLLVILVCFLLLLFVARLQAGRGRILPAVSLISSGLLVATIVAAPVIPSLLPVLVLVSLMAVAVALPYVSGGAAHFGDAQRCLQRMHRALEHHSGLRPADRAQPAE